MHRVQTLIHVRRPSTMACTRFMFGVRTRRVWRPEWLIVFPATGFFPQISQTFAI